MRKVLGVVLAVGLLAPAVVLTAAPAGAAMLAPELKAKWTLQGLDPVGKPAGEFAAHLRQQQKEYGDVIREAHIQAE